MKARLTLFLTLLLVCTSFLLNGRAAFGYAGEQGTVGAGVTPATVSTHHLHLTRALAYCAGFEAATSIPNPVNPVISHDAAKDAEIIAMYDELTDQGTIKDDKTTWTNIATPWSYTDKTASDFKECAGKGTNMVFPVRYPPPKGDLPPESFWNPAVGWFTNRFGPWATQFHFPTADDLERMRTFAMATASGQTLSALTVYAFGQKGSNMWTGDCYPEPEPTPLDTTGSMTSGSLQALGTYLHSLGDSYSHGVCRGNWPSNFKPPWVYHSPATSPQQQVNGCGFNSHSLEFGCPATPQQVAFEKNVIEGGIQVFEGLLAYGSTHGRTAKLTSATAHHDWLRRQLERYASLYKTNTFAEAGRCRVSFTYALMQICGTPAVADPNACLPDAVAMDCTAEGHVKAPCNADPGFPNTPACSTSAAQSKTAP